MAAVSPPSLVRFRCQMPVRVITCPQVSSPLGHNITTVNQTAYDLGEGEMHLRRGRQVSLRVKRGTLRSKVARGCAVSNKIESLVAEGKLTPSQEYPPKERSD